MTPEEAQALYASADQAFKEADYYRARTELERLVAAVPNHAEGHHYLGFLLAHRFHRLFLDEGITHLQRSVQLGATWHRMQNLGDALFAAGLIDGAASCYKGALAVAGAPPLSLYGLAQCRELSGDLREALTLYRRAVAHDDNPVRAHAVALAAKRVETLLRGRGIYFVGEDEQDLMEEEPDQADPVPPEPDLVASLTAAIARARRSLAETPVIFATSATAQLDAISACLAAGRLLPQYSGKSFLLGRFGARELDGSGAGDLASALMDAGADWDRLRALWYAAGK